MTLALIEFWFFSVQIIRKVNKLAKAQKIGQNQKKTENAFLFHPKKTCPFSKLGLPKAPIINFYKVNLFKSLKKYVEIKQTKNMNES